MVAELLRFAIVNCCLAKAPGEKQTNGESLLMEITSDPLIDLWVFVS